MGILPLRLPSDRRPQSLGLHPDDRVGIDAPVKALKPRATINARMLRKGVEINRFVAIAATETNLECEILRVGGLLPLILRRHSGAEQVARILEGSPLLRFEQFARSQVGKNPRDLAQLDRCRPMDPC